MPTLDVISVNIWSILISLCNLLILFFIIKKFLYKPVRKMLAERQAAVDKVYSEADEALRSAEQDRLTYSQKLEQADSECDALLKSAKENADQARQRDNLRCSIAGGGYHAARKCGNRA